MLDRRLRRRSNIDQTLLQCLLFAGLFLKLVLLSGVVHTNMNLYTAKHAIFRFKFFLTDQITKWNERLNK